MLTGEHQGRRLFDLRAPRSTIRGIGLGGSPTVDVAADLGRPTAGGLSATDGTHIYVPTNDHRHVLVVDSVAAMRLFVHPALSSSTIRWSTGPETHLLLTHYT